MMKAVGPSRVNKKFVAVIVRATITCTTFVVIVTVVIATPVTTEVRRRWNKVGAASRSAGYIDG